MTPILQKKKLLNARKRQIVTFFAQLLQVVNTTKLRTAR